MSTRKRKPFAQNTSENSISTKKTKSDENAFKKRAGVVNRITLKNFMCHSFLEVTFIKNTFVIGKNGSGKSAILTALIVGLGGKASLTNRGTSVKGFVKAGKPSANIEIELCNEGPMAYRPNVFGNNIIIIRNITASGSSSYKVKSDTGDLISTQSREVHNITIGLNIQVDNPICILNQDTSRNFLNSNNPKNKFTLFMKATKLESLEVEYKKTQSNKKECVTVLNEKSVNFKKLQDQIKQLKQKIDNHKSIISLRDKKDLLQRELLWAKVRDTEEELQEYQLNLDTLEKKLNNYKTNSAKRAENLEEFKENVKLLEQQLLEIKQKIEVKKRPQVELKSEIEELFKNVSSKKREKQQLLTSIQNKNIDIRTLKQDISESKENMSKVEKQKMEKTQNLATLQNKLKDLDDHLGTAKNDLFQMRGDLSRKENEEDNLKQEILQIDRNLNNEKNKLNDISAESSNELHLYGREIPKLKQVIAQNKHKFQHEPRGPLGSYIKIKNKKWTVAVEGYIGPSILQAFTVDNKQDNQLLREIFNKVLGNTRHPQIITSKFITKKHNVSKNLVCEPDDCISVFNAIEIDDPIVSNCIVDNCSPEYVLLIPSDTRAQQILSDRQFVPRNCHQGITAKGDKYYPDPNYRSYASSYHRAQYLQIDTKEHLKELKRSIENMARRKEEVMDKLETLKNGMKEQIMKRQQLEEKMKKVNLARVQIKKRLEELNSTDEPEFQNVNLLEDELKECVEVVKKETAALEEINDSIKEIKLLIQEKECGLSEIKNSTKEMEEEFQRITNEIRENHIKQKELSTGEEFEKKVISEYETRVSSARSQVNLKNKEVEKSTFDASSVGERLSEIRQVPTITKEITEIKNKISRIETDPENVTEVVDKCTELTEKFKTSRDIMTSLQADINELSLALEKRSRHYKLTENYFVAYMKYSFKKILEYGHFKGNLDINIADKKLDLIVIPQHGSQGHTTTSNLSGGERSFSTVAFLYSLWQCMELPFYFLDEFDVYMDKLTRTKVVDILLHHAISRPQLLFVFLTPQDVSFINQDVAILRLEDPHNFNV